MGGLLDFLITTTLVVMVLIVGVGLVFAGVMLWTFAREVRK